MQDAGAGAQGAGLEGLLAGNAGLLLVIGVGLIALALLLFLLILLARRQQRRDLRQIVQAVESLRSGRAPQAADLDPRSPFAVLASAVNTLGQDLAARAAEAERRGTGLHALLEATSDFAMITTDTDFDVLGLSAGAAALLGVDEEDAVGRPAAALFDEAAWKELLPKLGRKSLRERAVETRSVLLRRDGTRFHGAVAVRMLRGHGGETRGYLFALKDVDSEVRIERELAESEARYRGLVEGMPEAVVVLRGGRIAYANRSLAELLGVRPEDLAGMALRDRVATRDVIALQDLLGRLERGAAGARQEMRLALVPADGRPAASVRLSLVATVVGGDPAVIGTAADETALRRVESELRRSESRLDAVLEATSDAVVSLADRPEGAIVRMTNRAFLEMFGLREADVLGAAEGDLLRILRDRGEGAEAVAGLLASASHEARRGTARLGGPSGRALELSVSPLVDRRGAHLGRILVCRDASRERAEERRLGDEAESLRAAKAEAEASYRGLFEAHETLEASSRELERLNRELRTLDRMKTNLLANVTHELQTPLVAVRGYTEMILKERLGAINEEQRKGLALSLKNIDRLISMIDNLLAFARMDRESAELSISVFPLRALLDESVETLRSKAEAKRIRVATELEDPEVAIQGDRERLLQVFLNLLSNAVKFNRDGGEIRIETRAGKQGLVGVQVKDTGIGIPEEDLERIFDRFYRAGGDDGAAAEGTGLGLSIVRSILRLHGCQIRAESQVGRGTTFTFSLPVASVEGEGEAVPPTPAGDASAAPASVVPPAAPPSPPEAAPQTRPRFRIIRRS